MTMITNVEATKVKLDNNKYLTRDWYDIFTLNPHYAIELVDNTDQCLTDCSATLKIIPYHDIKLKKLDNFLLNFVNEIKVKGYSIKILKEINYQEDVSTPTNCQEIPDITSTNGTMITQCDYVTSQVTKTREEWMNFDDETLLKDKPYSIKIEGKKDPKANVDWIATVDGEQFKE
jgi:hypothetical protein